MNKGDKTPYCNCLFYSANALARIMTKKAEAAFSPTGLAPSHAFVLMSVNQTPGIQPSDISKIMMLTPSTVSRLVEKLESKNFVTRETDGKSTRVYPTAAGRKLDSKLRASWKALYDLYADALGKQASRDVTSAIYGAVMKLESK